jgi:hypothetical protein
VAQDALQRFQSSSKGELEGEVGQDMTTPGLAENMVFGFSERDDWLLTRAEQLAQSNAKGASQTV